MNKSGVSDRMKTYYFDEPVEVKKGHMYKIGIENGIATIEEIDG